MQALYENLIKVFEDAKDVIEDQTLQTRVRALMEDYSTNHDDWKKFEIFNDNHYTRNLVGANDHFELMVLCWRSGQGSRIHNHQDSHCFMSILNGQMTEHLYMLVDNEGKYYFENERPTPVGHCPKMEETKTTRYVKGEVGYINDKMGLHVVRTGELYDGVTLHLYAPPITKVKIFEPARGRVSVRLPGFYSVNSQLVSPMQRLIHDLLYVFSYSTWKGVDCARFGQQIDNYISAYCKANPTDWNSHAHYNDLVYTRNLVTRNEYFEVLIVCWRAGQSARISSYGTSYSFAGVLHGQLIQHTYQLLDESGNKYTERQKATPVGANCPNLSDSETKILDVGQTSFMHDGLGLHSLRAGELHDCVMIQVNTPPVKEVKVFEPARNRVSIRTPSYYSLEAK